MSVLKQIKKLAVASALALTATAATAGPGCVGKMWNPVEGLDFTLMGGIKVGGMAMMKDPALGAPPKHKTKTVCTCKDGLQTGVGVTMQFWLPSYINDVARQAGCLGFLDGINVLPGFMSQSSGQEYNIHSKGSEGSTGMQIHYAYADVISIIGGGIMEQCDISTGPLSIAYMTEPDFVFQSDVYSVVLTPQAAILAASPIMALMACGFESMANTLGSWEDWGVCAWNGSRFPLSTSSISKTMAQVTNMDVTIKYLTRSAMLGGTLRTTGNDTICAPKYNPFYDPFQHRYQWIFPGKVSTRYNQDVMRWGMFIKDNGQGNMTEISGKVSIMAETNSTIAKDSQNKADSASGKSPTTEVLAMAERVVESLPKPLNYPTKEAGFMQIWEARQCCLMLLTIESVLKMMVMDFIPEGILNMIEQYNMVNNIYKITQDPIGGAMSFIGGAISGAVTGSGTFSGAPDLPGKSGTIGSQTK